MCARLYLFLKINIFRGAVGSRSSPALLMTRAGREWVTSAVQASESDKGRLLGWQAGKFATAFDTSHQRGSGHAPGCYSASVLFFKWRNSSLTMDLASSGLRTKEFWSALMRTMVRFGEPLFTHTTPLAPTTISKEMF